MNKLILLSLVLAITIQYTTTAPSEREATSAEADDLTFEDGGREKRGAHKYKPSRKTCLPGCSLSNSTGDEIETESCPSGFSCTDGPYNVTIDGEDHQHNYCFYDGENTSSSEEDEDSDMAWVNMDRHACSWDNGTLTITEDCCDGWSCSSETFIYNYDAITYTYQFCVKDSSDTLNLLRRMACSKIRPCKNA